VYIETADLVELAELGNERILDLAKPLLVQLTQTRRAGRKPAVYLRSHEADSSHGYISIYPQGLR